MSINDVRKKLKDLEANEVNKRVSKARQKENERIIKNYSFLSQRHGVEASDLVKESAQKANLDADPELKGADGENQDVVESNAEDKKLDKKD
jgi:hypothetical protein